MVKRSSLISIFAKHTYFLDDNNSPGKFFLRRITSRIRGEEIAKYLGAKLNPTEGYEKDVCIYVKAYALHRMKDGDYIDLLDDLYATERIKDKPKIKVIAMSTPHKEYLRRTLKNKITYIPHHHVNFEKFRRNRKKIINCGYVGSGSGYEINVNKKLAKLLAEIGLKFTPLYNYSSRKNIVNYYKKIDLQIIGAFNHLNVPYYHQTKIVNAMSFGIPTIASRRLGYRDVEGYYIAVNNLDELLKEAKKMKDPIEYNKWPKKIIAESEKYHISEIAKLYKKLK
ncbi:MAG: glycosyltransferase [Candidatus Curtissbacteria bacterium]|nr:glycosyltransferase [Candidatus Curtissbacteria bacterium]